MLEESCAWALTYVSLDNIGNKTPHRKLNSDTDL
jgi:hypothetical protein